MQSTPGNHAYPPTGGAEASNSSKTSSAAKAKESSATATNPSNHAYPPTAGASSGPKPSQSASGGTSSKSAGSSDTYSPQGKDFKADQAGIPKDKPNSGSLPVSQGQNQSKSPPAHLKGGSSTPSPATAGEHLCLRVDFGAYTSTCHFYMFLPLPIFLYIFWINSCESNVAYKCDPRVLKADREWRKRVKMT